MAPLRPIPVALLALAIGGCAAVPSPPPGPPPERSFRGVGGVALVRRLEGGASPPEAGAGRRRDPLDALQVALEGRGLRTITVELADRIAPERVPVAELARDAEWLVHSARASGSAASLGGRAAAALAPLGVDAAAVFVRGPAFGPPPLAPGFGPAIPAPPPAPASAIVLVARDGVALVFSWGGGADPWGAGPVNAAEAIDAAIDVLAPPPE